MQSAFGADAEMNVAWALRMGKTLDGFCARVIWTVPAQHFRDSLPLETLSERWVGSTLGTLLAQCSDNWVHRMRTPGSSLRTAATISGFGVSYLPRPIEKMRASGLVA